MLFFNYTRASAIINGLTLIIVYFLETSTNERFYQALILVPLFRILNLGMPVFFAYALYSYIPIYAVMLIPIYIIFKRGNFTPSELGLSVKGIWIYLPFAVFLGLILGWIEYDIIHPEMLTQDLAIRNILVLSTIMIFLVGLVEEFIFRSALQTVFEEILGLRRGVLAASLMFGLMFSVYGTLLELFFGFGVGLIFGFFFQRKRSLPLIALTHGIANIALFVIMPVLPTILQHFHLIKS